MIPLGGFFFQISYQGGTNHRDVVLTAVASTTTQVSTASQTSTYGDLLTFTAIVSASSGTPAGSVGFYDGSPTNGGILLGTGTVNASGHATFSTSALHVTGSPHSIYAVYDPSTTVDFLASTLTAFGQTITPAPLTIAVNNVNKAYGDPLPGFTFVYTGFQNDDSAANFTAQPSAVTTATVASHVNLNGYSIIPSGAVDPDYTFNYVDGTLTITPVILTVTADNLDKVYGCADPHTDGPLQRVRQRRHVRQPHRGTGPQHDGHPVQPDPRRQLPHHSLGPAVDPDYSFQYVSGALAITPVPLTVTAGNLSMTYGATVPALTYTITGFVNGDTAIAVSGIPAQHNGHQHQRGGSGTPSPWMSRPVGHQLQLHRSVRHVDDQPGRSRRDGEPPIHDLRRDRPVTHLLRDRAGQRRHGRLGPLRRPDDDGHVALERRQLLHHPGNARFELLQLHVQLHTRHPRDPIRPHSM